MSITREVRDRSEVDLNPPRPRNRTKITRRMMDGLLRLGNAHKGVIRQNAGAAKYNMHPRTVDALADAGLAVSYTVAIDWPDGTCERTPEVALTDWGRMLLDAFRHGEKRGKGLYYT